VFATAVVPRHLGATVTTLALLIPVFGIGASALSLGESLPGWELGRALWCCSVWR
jgi:O-acetylserine/cysteine efflux transporter